MALAAGLGASIIVAALAVFLSVMIARTNLNHLDDQLDTAAELVELNADTAQLLLGRIGDAGAFAVTLRVHGAVTAATTTQLPELPDGRSTRTVDGVEYRVRTLTLRRDTPNPMTVSVAAPTVRAQTVTRTQQRRVLLTGAAAVLAATGLGWIFGGRAVRPLVDLTRRIGTDSLSPDLTGTGRGVREAAQLSAAVGAMLARISEARGQTQAALDTARTFASTAAHELRTPLTAMRTDLEVMRGLDLPREQRTDIIDDVLRKQGGIESTLTALEQLASGELAADRHGHTTLDLVELADEAAHDARRHHPQTDIAVLTDPPLPVIGHRGGLRSILDNAITNAVKHGRATRVHITAHRGRDHVLLLVDDDGTGVPPEERDAVFTRFHRGANAHRDGSGLGLALVAQQAELHHGRAYIDDSPLGGARLVVEIA
ncbi:sensor histidine kinase [Nocardia bovistercoris]|uniref:sensor histidine kinase n=1 Tax=Nocardia bovistercoris TaxID=2785916 RepID=UPI002FCCF698